MAEVHSLTLASGLQHPYTTVYSKRAKYIRIKLSRQGELSVIVPEFTHVKLAHEFISSKQAWIEKHLSKIEDQEIEKRPDVLDLKLLQEIWTLSYIETKQLTDNSIKINQAKDFVLELYGNQPLLNDTALVKKALSQWCKAKARHIFNLMLQQLAERHGFHYQRLSIRAQKTRWGSCSHQKNINLNCKLLLMPLDVVKYVMIHELCHTIEMNHSSRFWKLVEDCDPNYKINRNKLKTLGRKVVI